MSSHTLAKRGHLRRQFLGQITPEDPDALKACAREQRRVIAAIEAEEFAFVQVSGLARSQRLFSDHPTAHLAANAILLVRTDPVVSYPPILSTDSVSRRVRHVF